MGKETKKDAKIESKKLNINKNYIYIGAVVIVIILAVIFLINNANKNASTDIPADNSADTTVPETDIPAEEVKPGKVEVLTRNVEVSRANERVKIISGNVKNTGDIPVFSVIITAKLYDNNNTLVETAFTRPLFNDLAVGQTSYYSISDIYDPFETYELSADWEIEK